MNPIDTLKAAINNKTVKVWVPSKQKELEFKPLTVGQQKDIMSVGFDGVTAPLTVTRLLNNIVQDNCIEKTEFSVYDKYHVIVGLRIDSIGSKVKGFNQTLTVPKTAKLKETAVITSDDITIECRIPSIDEENKLVTKLITEIKNKNITDRSALVSMLYVGEIIKFINSVSIDDIVIEFSDIQYEQKKEVVNTLPVKINAKIIEYIQSVREAETACLVLGDTQLTIEQLLVNV
jgi:hypothetical protein